MMSAHDTVVKGLIERYTQQHSGEITLSDVMVALGVPAEKVAQTPRLARVARRILEELGYAAGKNGNRVVWRKAGAS